MSSRLDELIDEIVKKARQQMLDQGLRCSPDEVARIVLDHLSPERSVPVKKGDSPATPSASIRSAAFARPTSNQELAAVIDHTLLKADATEADFERLCKEAIQFGFATVCVNSAFVPTVAGMLKGSTVKPIAVVGFPLGAASSASKAFEAREAIKNGAREIDMVINIGELKSRNYQIVLEDIRTVVEASAPYPVKVILETALLDAEQKSIACALSKAAGAAYVKTSTGFGPGGATAEDIRLMRKVVGSDLGVKASGGIRTTEDAFRMIDAGASRIGASASVSIVQGVADFLASESGATNTAGAGKTPFTGLPYKAANTTDNAPSLAEKARAPHKKKDSQGGGY